MSHGSSSLLNCCKANWFYGQGGAEGYPSFTSQEEFDKATGNRSRNKINICVTNSDQINARKFLEVQGWESVEYGKTLMLHHISGDALNKYLTNANAERMKKAAQEQMERERQMLEQRKAQEEKRAQEAAEKQKRLDSIPQVSLEEIQKLFTDAGFSFDPPYHPDQETRVELKRGMDSKYGVRLRGLTYYNSVEHVKNAINLQIRKQHEG